MTTGRRIVVLGGGPAGLSAAEEASAYGASTLLIDESSLLGGQYFRGRQGSRVPGSPQHFRRATNGVQVHLGTIVVDAPAERILSVWSADRGEEQLPYDALVLATGAHDRPVAMPGWTLPGVVTAGGAHTLAKAHGVIPGRRMVVAGAGPFLLAVAELLAAKGCQVSLVDATSRSFIVRRLLKVVPNTDLVRGAWLAARVLGRGGSIRQARMVTEIHGTERVEAVTTMAVDGGWIPQPRSEQTIEADGVCVGFGFVPNLEVAQFLGCELRYQPTGSDYAVAADPAMRTSKPGIYAAGELTGIGGFRVAVVEGQLAALTAAHDLGLVSSAAYRRRATAVGRRLRRLRRWADWIAETYRPRPGLWSLAGPTTVICRCEDVPLAAIEATLPFNAITPAAVKAATRAGMGLCQGRICSFLITEVLRARHGYTVPTSGRPWTVRPPFSPVPLGHWPATLETGS